MRSRPRLAAGAISSRDVVGRDFKALIDSDASLSNDQTIEDDSFIG